jgi:hypothetical protein
MRQSRHGEIFFLVMGIVLLAVVLAGFLPPALSRPGGMASIPLMLHVHGSILLAWFVLFCTQAHFAGTGKLRLHMKLGTASVSLAVAIVVLGYFVIRAAYARPDWNIAGWSPAASVMIPFSDIVNFVIAYSLALVNRRTPAAHKRLMLLAGLLIIDPAIARLVGTLGLAVPFILILELFLFGALIVYDFVTRGRPHWSSLLGLGLYIGALLCKLFVAQQAWWASFVNIVFG